MKILIFLIMTFNLMLFSDDYLNQNEIAPDFTIKDVNDKVIKLSDFKGKRVLITFYRSVGCPVCNLNFHTMQENKDSLKLLNIELISVYESPKSAIKQYLEGEEFYSIMIPDSTLSLYDLYKVERSTWKMIKSYFSGFFSSKSKGEKLFNENRPKFDANANRIGADFLIDEQGKIIIAYYGKIVGDHISFSQIREKLE